MSGNVEKTIPALRTDIPHSARIYDYLLGGKDNFQSDRDVAANMVNRWPSLRVSMRSNRDFMRRVGGYLAGELGLRQFLDIGTGLPTAPNLHEVVQGIAPESRIVYVDKTKANRVVHTGHGLQPVSVRPVPDALRRDRGMTAEQAPCSCSARTYSLPGVRRNLWVCDRARRLAILEQPSWPRRHDGPGHPLSLQPQTGVPVRE